MGWRRWNAVIHRDLGYLCAGLTVIYAVSGVAVNHIADWNPNYRMERIQTRLDPAMLASVPETEQAKAVLDALAVRGRLKDTFRPDPGTLKIFVEEENQDSSHGPGRAPGGTVTVKLDSGEVTRDTAVTRNGFHPMNFLHLNHAKKLWTWVADLYAVALSVLAVSGLFILRGKNGITGRGAWLTGTGVAIPAFFLWLYL